MRTFTVDFSIYRHKLIIYVVILLRENILANWFTPWRTSFKLSCAKNFNLYVINTLRDSGNFVKTLKMRVKLILYCPRAHAITYYLLTESEVITGKSQTEALMY